MIESNNPYVDLVFLRNMGLDITMLIVETISHVCNCICALSHSLLSIVSDDDINVGFRP